MTNTLSIIIPAYNEEKRIGRTLDSLWNYFILHQLPLEVIVVDDGSVDNTARVARRYVQTMPFLRILSLGANHGKGYAVRAGMQEAQGDYRLFMDADNSIDISNLDKFMVQMKGGMDMVVGSIEVGGAESQEHNGLYRRILSRVSKLPVRIFITSAIKDTQRGFKLFTKQAAEIIFSRQTIDRWGFDLEIFAIALKYKLSIKELPVEWDNPAGSKVTLGSYLTTFRELGRIIMNKFSGTYDMVVFDAETEARKGKGFIYKEKEFIHHSALPHAKTAFWVMLDYQKVVLATLIALYILCFILSWYITLIVTFSGLTILYFLDLLFGGFIIYKSFKDTPEINVTKEEIAALRDEDLPMYTIFCPLYKEWRVVPQFAKAMSRLDYPANKLQIMFLLEENDAETIKKIEEANLPAHFERVIVPHSFPKTKPKAMNYGLQFARGEYLVIYDAEDMPDADQLKKAVIAFTKAPANTACIQAKLNFYNATQNVLTRMFTAEYSLWFDLILPGLQSFGAPIPLGGTSNHFLVSHLKNLSGWDAFNVTEDCDLGIRIAKGGLKTAIVESTTYEEANSRMKNWYNQRSRWVKGYIQTYLVHSREMLSSFKNCSLKEFLSFQVVVGGKVLSMFINPLMWGITICYFLFRVHVGLFVQSLFPLPVLYIGVFSLVFGNFMYLYYYMVGCSKRGYDGFVKYVFFVPFYWLGMSLAAWKGLYEIIVKPHYWSKTVHGLHLAGAKKATDDIASVSTIKTADA